MQEEADTIAHAAFAQHRRQRDQVIVVDPYRVARADQRHQLFGEQAVDAQIAGQMLAVVIDQVRSIVQQRPQRAVGEAVIEFVVIAAREIHGGVLDRAIGEAVEFAAALS